MSELSHLEKLLGGAEVEWRALWEVTSWDKKFNAVDKFKQPNIIKYHYFLAKEIKSLVSATGDVKLLTTNISNLYTTESLAGDKISEGEVIAIPWGGNAVVQYYKGKFLTSDNRIATSNDTKKLKTKYLYYFLLSKVKTIESFYRGSGIKHPSMADILDISIPIPSIEAQSEIVRILDKFTALTTELTAELTARKKQHNYYRDQLLSFEEGECEWVTLSAVLKEKGYIRGPFGSALKKEFFVESGVPVYEQQHAINDKREFRYFITKEKSESLKRFLTKENDIIISCSGTIGKTSIISKTDCNGVINQALLILRLDHNKVDARFIRAYLNCYPELITTSSGGAITNIASRDVIQKIKIPLVPVMKQVILIDTLDKFEKMTNSITEGLPREIELRQKQYEYYRDLLFRFPKPESVTN